MKIYKLDTESIDENVWYMCTSTFDSEEMRILNNRALNGESILQIKSELKCKRNRTIRKRAVKNISYINTTSITHFVVDDKAREFFQDNYNKDFELYPIRSEEGMLYLLYTINVEDAFKYEEMEYNIICYDEKGVPIINNIKNFAFDEDRLKRKDVFRCRAYEFVKSQIFVTESFKKKYEESGLTGLVFIETLNNK